LTSQILPAGKQKKLNKNETKRNKTKRKTIDGQFVVIVIVVVVVGCWLQL